MAAPEETDTDPAKTKAGFVALIGAPNAGKSTLLNSLVGSKVSIVSRKVQTTRVLVRGIAIEGASQIIFVDTPGIFKPKRRLDRAMVTSAWGGASDADVVALLLDARKGIDEEAEAILAKLPDVKRPKILILNKIDLIERRACSRLPARSNEKDAFDDTFMISALKGDGLDELEALSRREDARGSVALPGGPDLRCAAADARSRDHPGEDLRAPARGTALSIDRRDGPVAAAAGRLHPHRADGLRRARQPDARSCSARAARPSRRSARRPARRSPRSPRRRCTSSCS